MAEGRIPAVHIPQKNIRRLPLLPLPALVDGMVLGGLLEADSGVLQLDEDSGVLHLICQPRCDLSMTAQAGGGHAARTKLTTLRAPPKKVDTFRNSGTPRFHPKNSPQALTGL